MKAIKVLLDNGLISMVDREAKRLRSSRSKLIRAALSVYLATSRRRALDERYRRGYEQKPAAPDELADWQTIQEWPEQ